MKYTSKDRFDMENVRQRVLMKISSILGMLSLKVSHKIFPNYEVILLFIRSIKYSILNGKTLNSLSIHQHEYCPSGNFCDTPCTWSRAEDSCVWWWDLQQKVICSQSFSSLAKEPESLNEAQHFFRIFSKQAEKSGCWIIAWHQKCKRSCRSTPQWTPDIQYIRKTLNGSF